MLLPCDVALEALPAPLAGRHPDEVVVGAVAVLLRSRNGGIGGDGSIQHAVLGDESLQHPLDVLPTLAVVLVTLAPGVRVHRGASAQRNLFGKTSFEIRLCQIV